MDSEHDQLLLKMVDEELCAQAGACEAEANRIKAQPFYHDGNANDQAHKLVASLYHKADVIDFTRRMVMVRLKKWVEERKNNVQVTRS